MSLFDFLKFSRRNNPFRKTKVEMPKYHVPEKELALYEDNLHRAALKWLPEDYKTEAGQKKMLAACAKLLPQLGVVRLTADARFWEAYRRGEMPFGHTVARIVAECNTALNTIETDVLNDRLLRSKFDRMLPAWAALDYYTHLVKPEFCPAVIRTRRAIASMLKLRGCIVSDAPAQEKKR